MKTTGKLSSKNLMRRRIEPLIRGVESYAPLAKDSPFLRNLSFKNFAPRHGIIALLLAVIPGMLFAQELKLSGEAKTGIYWEQTQQEGQDPEAKVTLHSMDDAGGNNARGRFRLNFDYDNGKNFGFRARINWENWVGDQGLTWPFAFAYGNFFDDQLTISVGKLGGSPWGTGGPEMWKELEQAQNGGGMRVEWKPGFIPEEIGAFNVGFVLNYFNGDMDQGWDQDKPISLLNLLQESVIGISYTHEYFHMRFAYRLDSEYDAAQDNKLIGAEGQLAGSGEDELVYRLEERILSTYLPGLQIWALGHWYGIPRPELQWFRNWLFIQYEPDIFTAQLRFGYDYIDSRSDFYIKPSFYYHLLNKLISVGAAFQYCQDFGDGKLYKDSPYRYIEFMPKVQINFTSSYIAFEYLFRQEYLQPWATLPRGKEPLRQTQWMNLRFCIYY